MLHLRSLPSVSRPTRFLPFPFPALFRPHTARAPFLPSLPSTHPYHDARGIVTFGSHLCRKAHHVSSSLFRRFGFFDNVHNFLVVQCPRNAIRNHADEGVLGGAKLNALDL